MHRERPCSERESTLKWIDTRESNENSDDMSAIEPEAFKPLGAQAPLHRSNRNPHLSIRYRSRLARPWEDSGPSGVRFHS